jgi:hypothetical protein
MLTTPFEVGVGDGAHWLAEQNPLVQTLPQPPQLLGSLVVSVQAPLQLICVPGHGVGDGAG